MMTDNRADDTSRLARIVAMLTVLQTKRLITASELAKRFGVSPRTIYRDIRTLQQAGIPVLTEEGKGFTLMSGFKLPPFLFTEKEAAAVITAAGFMAGSGESSLAKDHSDAVAKIKAVLRDDDKNKMDLLSSRLKFYPKQDKNSPVDILSSIQQALMNYSLVKLRYHSITKNEVTDRFVEPFAFFHTSVGWTLVAFCRLREDYRIFRLDHVVSFDILEEKFSPHTISVAQYLERFKK